jgi:hypothetical protein
MHWLLILLMLLTIGALIYALGRFCGPWHLCAWCKQEFNDFNFKRSPRLSLRSHSICAECAEKQNADFNKIKS